MIKKLQVMIFTTLTYLFVLLIGSTSFAQQLNYHGRIVDGVTNLGVSGSRNFRIQVRTPSGLADNCLMYEESQTKTLVNGVFVINLNNGSGVRLDSTAPVYTLAQIFSNKNTFGSFTFAGSRCVSTNPFVYTPTLTDSRRVNIWFEDPILAPGVWEPLPTQTVGYVPSAIEALNVGGFSSDTLMRAVDALGSPVAISALTPAQYTNIMTLAGGTFVQSAAVGTGGSDFNITTTPSATGTALTFNIPSSSATNRGLLLPADWTTFNNKMPNTGVAVNAALGYVPLSPANNLSDLSNAATSRTNLGLGTAAVLNAAPAATEATATQVVLGDDPRLTGALVSGSTAGGDLSGTYPNPTVDTVGSASAAQISTSITDTINATDAATASTLVRRDAVGGATFSSVSATSFSGNNFYVYNSGNANRIQIVAPTPMGGGNYTLTLPPDPGTAGLVLSTNGAGVTSWVSASSTSVTSVTASSPLASSGGFTPNISIPAATGAVSGYLASSDWTTFNNKLSTTLPTGQAWIGDGSNVAAAQFLNISNVKSTVAGNWFNAGACAAGQILSYSAVTDQVTCSAMTLTGSQVATALNGIMTGDATITTGGVITIGNSAVTDAKINSVAWSKVTSTPITIAGYGITDAILTQAGGVDTMQAGTFAARPAANAVGVTNRVYVASDTQEIYYSDGVVWTKIGSTNGLGGTVTSVAVNAPLTLSGVASVSPTISLPVATAGVDGYLSSSDFTNFSAKVNRAGDTMTGALNMGSNNITATGNIAMSANRNIQIGAYAADPACTALDAGKVWYHTGSNALHYCDGTTVQSIGSIAGVVTGVNGLTGNVNIALGSSGTDANIATSSPNVTINLPTSSVANRGLLSSSDFSLFNSKQAGSAELTAVAGLGTTGFIRRTGAGAYSTVTSIDLTSSVSGVLPLANGGTGATTQAAALNNLLPAQATHANKFIQTDGAGNVTWQPISAVAVTSVTAAATAGNPIVIGGTASAPTVDIPAATNLVNGYLSSADRTYFNAKLDPSNNLSDVLVPATARTNLGLGTGSSPTFTGATLSGLNTNLGFVRTNGSGVLSTALLSSTDVTTALGYTPSSNALPLNQIFVGNGSSVATAVTMSGDATIASNGTLTLATVSVAGAYTKVTIDTKGRVISASNMVSSDVTSALGYTPVNRAGDTMTGALNMGGQNLTNTGVINMASNGNIQISNRATDPAGLVAADAGRTWYNTTTNTLKYFDGTTIQSLGNVAGVVTGVNGITGAVTINSGGAGTDLNIATAGSTVTVNIPSSSVANRGLLSSSDFSLFNSKQPGSSELTGVAGLGTTGFILRTGAGAYSTVSSIDLTSSVSGTLPLANGGTGATTAGAARTNLALGTGDSPTFTGLTVSGVNGNTLVKTNGSGVLSNATSTDVTSLLGFTPSSSTLPTNQIFVGNGSNIATAVAVSGDATIVSNGTISLKNTGTAGTYGGASAIPTITTDAQGRVTTVTTNAYQDATAVTKGVLSVGTNLQVTSGVISLQNATSAQNGALTSSDWTTFNSKQSASAELNGLAGLSTTGFIQRTGAGTYSTVSSIDLTTAVSGTLPVANGGTGLTATGSNGNVMYVTGGAFATATPDTAGLVDKTNAQTIAGNKTFSNNLKMSSPTALFQLQDGTTNTISMRAPAAVTSYTMTWPNAVGTAGQVLTTDASGILSWTSTATGTVTSVTSANADIGVATTTTTPVLTLNSGLGASQIAKVGASAISNNTVIVANGSGGLAGQALTNGQILIGSTGAAPVAAGITGTANQITVTNGAGSITLATPQNIHSGASPTFTGLTLSGLTNGIIKSTAGVLSGGNSVALSTDVTGTLPVANGGTGATTADGALTNLLPSQTGNNGKVLSTNGTVTAWISTATGTVTNVTGTAPVSVATGTTTPVISMARSTAGVDGYLASTDFTMFAAKMSSDFSNVSGTLPIANGGTGAVTAGAARTNLGVGTGDSPTFTGLTVSGVNGNTLVKSNGSGVLSNATSTDVTTLLGFTPGSVTSITAGTGLTGGTITTSGTIGLGTELAGLNGLSTTGFIRRTAAGTYSTVSSIDLTANVSGTLPVANGGTGATSIGSGNLVIGGGTGAVTSLAAGSAGNVVYATGAASWGSGTADTAGLVDKTNAQAISGAKSFSNNLKMSSPTALFQLQDGTTNTISMRAPAAVTSYTMTWPNAVGTAGQVLTTDASGILSWSSAASGTVTNVTGTAPVSVATGTTTPVISMAKSTAGADGYLASTDFTIFAAKMSSDFSNVTGTLGLANGGTGATTAGAARTNLGLGTGDSPTFTGLTVSGVNGNTLVKTNGSGVLSNATSSDVTTLLGFTPGSVTSITAGTGLTGGTITTSGTIGLGTELSGLNGLATNGFIRRTAAGTYSTVSSIDLTANVSGTLPVANGGTGLTATGSNGNVMYVTGGAFSTATPDTAGLVDKTNAQTIAGNKTFSNNLKMSSPTALFQLQDGTTNTISMRAPAAVTSYTMTWPNAVGTAGQVLTTDASGILSWSSAATGTVTSVTSANTDISVATTTTTPVLTLNSGLGASQIAKVGASAISNNTVIVANGSGGLAGQALTNGQLLIGSTGAAPVAAGITGTANQVSVTNGAGSITLATPQNIHSGASPTFTGLTLSGLTNGIIKSTAGVLSGGNSVALSTDVTGILPVANGGTGTTTLTANSVLLGNGTGAVTATSAMTNGQLLIGSTGVAPAVATVGSSNGISLTTGAGTFSIGTNATTATGNNTLVMRDGSGVMNANGVGFTNTGTVTVSAASASATYGIVLPGAQGAANTLLRNDGAGNLSWATAGTVTNVTGTAPVSVATGTTTPVISMARSTGAVDGYLAAADFTMFAGKMSSDFSNVTGTLPVANGGTGATTASAARTNLGLGTGDSPTFTGLTVSGLTTGIIKSTAGVLSGGNSVALSTDVTGTLPVANGGTGATTLAANALLVGNGTSAVNFLAPTNGNVIYGATGAWTSGTPDTAGLVDKTNAQTIAGNKTFTGTTVIDNQQEIRFREATGGGTNYIGLRAPAALAGDVTFNLPVADGTTGQVLSTNGSGQWGWVSALTGTVAVGSGGTGLTAGTSGGIPYFSSTSTMASSAVLTANGVVLGGGAGSSPTTTAAFTANGQLLIGNGASAPSVATLTGTANQITVTNGAGSITLATPQNIHSGASPTFTGLTLSGLTNGFVRSTAGVLSTVSSVDLTTSVSGTLPVANGGTGKATVTTGAILAGNGTSALTEITATTTDNVMSATSATNWQSRTPSSAGLYYKNGNAFGATATVGTTDNFGVNISTNNTTRIALDTSGAVQVNGQAFSNANTGTCSSGAATCAWNANTSNIMVYDSGSQATPATTITNMQPGGSYMLVLKGTGTGTATITCNGTAPSYVPANGSRVAGVKNKSVYTLMWDGTDCLVTWITGF